MSTVHAYRSLVDSLRAALGPSGVITETSDMAPYLEDQRGIYRAACSVVARPGTVGEVARVVELCRDAGVGVVPQGGNTSLVGGSIPDESGEQILLSLSRMNQVRAIDPLNFTLVAEAGCVLADIQATAAAQGLLFPLSLASEGSCQIGGNLSTNAGGTAVLRYGNARDLVLGLEVVLASGEIWNGLRTLRKDNTGYDLKQLFLGSEGTLGIITAAALKLFPEPSESCTAFAAISDPRAGTRLLGELREAHGDAVTTFEYTRAWLLASSRVGRPWSSRSRGSRPSWEATASCRRRLGVTRCWWRSTPAHRPPWCSVAGSTVKCTSSPPIRGPA